MVVLALEIYDLGSEGGQFVVCAHASNIRTSTDKFHRRDSR